MAMTEAELKLRKTGRPEDIQYADIIKMLRDLRGGDVYDETLSPVFNSVDQAVDAYKSQLRTPELVTKVHQIIWNERGRLVGQTFELPPCPYTQNELKTLEEQGKRVGYLPPQLSTQQGRHLLDGMFPNLQSHSVREGNTVTNEQNQSGWFDYETSNDAPYLNTTEPQLRKRVAEEGRCLLNLNQYIIAGQDSKLLTGHYLDENATLTRLGSCVEGRVVGANFDRGGYLNIIWLLESDVRYRRLGGRSSGVKRP